MGERIEVGYVARAHGIRGELRVVLHNRDSDVLEHVEVVFVGQREHAIEAARPAGDAWLVALDGVPDRNAAEALRGATVSVRRDALPLDEGEALLADLVGCRAELADGTPWGEIVGIAVGPQDRLVVRDGDVERELPAVAPLIVEVDLDARRVVVAPPEGLPETPARKPR